MNPEERRYIRTYLRAWKARRRARAIAQLGGRCVDCAGTDQLEFDHVDPSTKVAAISDLMTAREEVFQAELKKCVPRCYECHKAKTRNMGEYAAHKAVLAILGEYAVCQ